LDEDGVEFFADGVEGAGDERRWPQDWQSDWISQEVLAG